MSLIVQIAEAVKTTLNTGGVLGSAVAVRRYLPLQHLEQLDGTAVTVVPRENKTGAQLHRKKWMHHPKVDVAVQARVDSDANSDIDPLTDLMDAIEAFMLGRIIEATAPTQCVGVEHTYIYVPEHLQQLRVFTGVLTLVLKTGL